MNGETRSRLIAAVVVAMMVVVIAAAVIAGCGSAPHVTRGEGGPVINLPEGTTLEGAARTGVGEYTTVHRPRRPGEQPEDHVLTWYSVNDPAVGSTVVIHEH